MFVEKNDHQCQPRKIVRIVVIKQLFSKKSCFKKIINSMLLLKRTRGVFRVQVIELTNKQTSHYDETDKF